MFIWRRYVFQKTSPFRGWYVYLGRYVFEKLPGRGGGTFIWVGTFIWHWIVVCKTCFYLIYFVFLSKDSPCHVRKGQQKISSWWAQIEGLWQKNLRSASRYAHQVLTVFPGLTRLVSLHFSCSVKNTKFAELSCNPFSYLYKNLNYIFHTMYCY